VLGQIGPGQGSRSLERTEIPSYASSLAGQVCAELSKTRPNSSCFIVRNQQDSRAGIRTRAESTSLDRLGGEFCGRGYDGAAPSVQGRAATKTSVLRLFVQVPVPVPPSQSLVNDIYLPSLEIFGL
jgi:hypothetical protein